MVEESARKGNHGRRSEGENYEPGVDIQRASLYTSCLTRHVRISVLSALGNLKRDSTSFGQSDVTLCGVRPLFWMFLMARCHYRLDAAVTLSSPLNPISRICLAPVANRRPLEVESGALGLDKTAWPARSSSGSQSRVHHLAERATRPVCSRRQICSHTLHTVHHHQPGPE